MYDPLVPMTCICSTQVCAETDCEKARPQMATLRTAIMLGDMKNMVVVGVRMLFVGKRKSVVKP